MYATMKKKLCLTASLSAALLLTACNSQAATLINVDWGKGPGGSGNGGSAIYTGSAAIGSAGDFWNATDSEANVFSDLEDLTDAGGTPTTFDVTWDDNLQSSVNTGAIEFGSTGHNALMEDYAFTGNGQTGAVVTISDLPANTGYTLYLYGVPDSNGQETAFTLDGNTQIVTAGNIADDNGLATPDDYVVFMGNTGVSGEIVYTQFANFGTFSGSNGFQLVVVPEPSTIALSMLGLVGLVVYRARGK